MPLDIIQKQELAAQRGDRKSTSFDVEEFRSISGMLGALEGPLVMSGMFGSSNTQGIAKAAAAVKADVDHWLAAYEADPDATGRTRILNGHVCKFLYDIADCTDPSFHKAAAAIKAKAYTPAPREGTPSEKEMAELLSKIFKL